MQTRNKSDTADLANNHAMQTRNKVIDNAEKQILSHHESSAVNIRHKN